MSPSYDGPARLDDDPRLLSRDECTAIWKRVESFAQGGGTTHGEMLGTWRGELRWARNRVSLASDRREVLLAIYRNMGGLARGVITNQLDDASLEAAVRAAERAARVFGRRDARDLELPPPAFEYPKTAIWSDATYDLSTEARGQVARAVIEPAEAKEMLSAGFLEMRGSAFAAFPVDGPMLYARATEAQCSLTVRDATGTGSGWAGLSSYDWRAIDAEALAARALEKAIASRNPVALEPGRYTVILEPQAVHDLVRLVIEELDRQSPEVNGAGPFVLGRDDALDLYRTKLGLKVADERVTIEHDPLDPLLGVVPASGGSDHAPARPVTWIERGVLTALADPRSYALASRNDNLPVPNTFSYRMRGGESSLEEMIRTTRRGLLVTRFSNVRVMDTQSLLSTGLTRDGLWLVENGRISKAVKNFRFTESPLFVLNSLEQLGTPVPVFNPTGERLTPAVVPSLKARDFSFTSTIDAI